MATSLRQLQQLHARGDLSDADYERFVSALTAAYTGACLCERAPCADTAVIAWARDRRRITGREADTLYGRARLDQHRRRL